MQVESGTIANNQDVGINQHESTIGFKTLIPREAEGTSRVVKQGTKHKSSEFSET